MKPILIICNSLRWVSVVLAGVVLIEAVIKWRWGRHVGRQITIGWIASEVFVVAVIVGCCSVATGLLALLCSLYRLHTDPETRKKECFIATACCLFAVLSLFLLFILTPIIE
jgi:hypothetical protein